MKVLGSLSAQTLVYLGASEMVFTIITCYVTAVSLGHVEPWLPTISACGDHKPEEFLFRYGIFLGALMLEIEAFAMFLSNKTSSLTFGLGAVAALGLSVVAVVGANEFNPLHTTAAVIFFLFEDIMSVLMTVDLLGKMSWSSLVVKIASCTVGCVSITLRLLMMNNLLTIESFPALAVFEWSNTAAIIVYQLSLANELSPLALAIIDTDSTNVATPKTTPPAISDRPLNTPPMYNESKKPLSLEVA